METNWSKNLRMAGIDPSKADAFVHAQISTEIIGKVVVLDPVRFGYMKENLEWRITSVDMPSTPKGCFVANRVSDGDKATVQWKDVTAIIK